VPGVVFLPPEVGGNVPHFDVRFDTGDEGRGLVYLPPLPENGQAFCSLPLTKPPPVFLTVQAGRESAAPRFRPAGRVKGLPPTSIHQSIYRIIHNMD